MFPPMLFLRQAREAGKPRRMYTSSMNSSAFAVCLGQDITYLFFFFGYIAHPQL